MNCIFCCVRLSQRYGRSTRSRGAQNYIDLVDCSASSQRFLADLSAENYSIAEPSINVLVCTKDIPHNSIDLKLARL